MAYLLVQHSVRLPAEGLEEYKTVPNLSVLVHALGCHSSAIVRIWNRIRNRKDSRYHSEGIFYLPPPDVHVLLLAKLGRQGCTFDPQMDIISFLYQLEGFYQR